MKEPMYSKDRRTLRSKRLILEAVRELVLEKDFNKISVKDIVERADIGRATFYAHFEDKYDLFGFIFSRLLLRVEEEFQNTYASLDQQQQIYQKLIPSQALFQIVQQNHDIFKRYANAPELGMSSLAKPLVDRLEQQLDTMQVINPDDGIPRHQIAHFLVNALLALLKQWVLEDMPESPETMDMNFQMLAEPTLKRLLGSG